MLKQAAHCRQEITETEIDARDAQLHHDLTILNNII